MVKAERTCLEGSDKMAKVNRIEPKIPTLKKRQKVVSAQVSYYSALIQKNPEWEYAGVYADMGISGTDTSKRGEFLRMLADCEEGKIEIKLAYLIQRI